jgi:dolichol-phosphate mannosyltransferase
MSEAAIIIPTFRERNNLEQLLPTLADILRRASIKSEIIVVDDNSDDGTDELCQRLATELPVRLLSRQGERGLATAVLYGLRAAEAEICVVMDADFSHPPEAVPRLVSAVCDLDCDMAIGSRYVAGGSLDPNWSWARRWNSKVASLLARGLTSAADPMAGFFAIRKETLVRAAEFRPVGYKIALELIVRCECRSITEIPIAFQDRRMGESKLTLKEQWHYVRHLGRLYWAKYNQLSRLPRREVTDLRETSPEKRRAA